MTYQPLWIIWYQSFLEEEQQWYYLTYNWKEKGIHAIFPKKVNAMARRNFELTSEPHFNNYATGTPHPLSCTKRH